MKEIDEIRGPLVLLDGGSAAAGRTNWWMVNFGGRVGICQRDDREVIACGV
ncbi:hypothetical protein Pd630_LPD03817 [Rhodococcus opacus PD630]|nr:hypothetical protein Pd630_LPD03817 [Rhodococcus opacus PD630]